MIRLDLFFVIASTAFALGSLQTADGFSCHSQCVVVNKGAFKRYLVWSSFCWSTRPLRISQLKETADENASLFAANEEKGELSNDDDDSGKEIPTMKQPQRQQQQDAKMERAWRHVKKPLLRVGAKGATMSHGNSLKQLLQQHTVVKVKVNTQPFGNSFQQAFDTLRQLAEENGAPSDIELLEAREASSTIFLGLPGTRQLIETGAFPPPPPPPFVKKDVDGASRR
ncbi:hypothetical protein ACA910_000638 [Epithemia clementina (nom. ined.)]